jgi:hypothetical protein
MMPIRNRIRRESEVPLAAERARTAAETRRILTPEQQGKFDELYERFESRRKQMLSTPSGWALTAERSNEHLGSLARNSLADSNKNVACGATPPSPRCHDPPWPVTTTTHSSLASEPA